MNNQIAGSIARNTTVLMSSQVVTGISSFVLLLFLPRYLGTEEYGRLYLSISVVMIFQIIIEFGGVYFIAKEVARSHEAAPALISNSIGMRMLLWAGLLLILITALFLIGYSPEVKVIILILAISKVWEVSEKVMLSTFQGFEVMQYSTRCNIVEKIFLTGAGIAALLLGARAITIAIVMAASTMLSFLLSLRFGKRLVHKIPHWEWPTIRNLLRQGFPYFLYSIFGVVYYRIDAVMLAIWTPDTVLGWYGAAYRFFDIFMFFPSIFSSALFPVLSRLWGKENNTLAITTQKSIEFMLLAGLPLSIMIVASGRHIIEFFFQFNAYAPSVVLLQIFAIGILLVYLDVMLGTALFAADRQRHWSIVAFAAIVVNISLNAFMIPYSQHHYGNGGIGAAIATLITEFFVMNCAVALIPKSMFRQMKVMTQLKTLGAGTAMAAAMWAIHHSNLPWTVHNIIGLIVYGAALYGFRVFNTAELAFLRNFLSVRNLRTTFAVNGKANA